jgi:hypothetical protein
VHEPTVSASDIARLAGVGRAAVSNWRRRYEDFPAPVDGTSSSPQFSLAQVERWLVEQGKLQPGAEWERLWRLVEAYRGEYEPADLLGAIGEFLVRRQPNPGSPVVDPALLREVTAVAATHGARTTFEGLWERFVRANARWVAVTPPELATLMADLGGGQVVLDPACGAGSVLAAMAGRARLLGQEIDQGMARIGATRLALADADADVRVGDSLLADAHRDRLVDTVLCDPPFNERHWGHEDLLHDPRWRYGIPPRMESELAWVQHALAHLKPGGVAVLTMPPSAASRRSGRRIRAELVRSGVLRAVVALPPIGSATPVHLWVLRNPVPGQTAPPELLVVDTSEQVRVSGPDWPRIREVTVGSWQRVTAGAVPEVPGVVRSVGVLDLLRDEVDLTPARNLPVHSGPRTVEHLMAQRNELAASLDRLPALLPAADWRPGRDELRVVSTVAELMATGALRLAQANASDAIEPGDAPFMHLNDLLGTGVPAGRVSRQAQQLYVATEVGDVVVPMTGTRLVARVATEAGIVLGRGLCLLRPNREVLDPWFVAGFLNSSANTRQASSHLSSGSRLDVKRCEIPRLTLAQQQPYAVAYRGIEAFTAALADVGRRARAVTQGMTDGMAESVIAPREHLGRP